MSDDQPVEDTTASDPICRSCATQECGSTVPEECSCTALVAPGAPSPAVEALVLMVEAFLSRHGCFPFDKTTDQERLWNRAMLAAYDVIGQPRTRERDTKLAALTAAALVAPLPEMVERDSVSNNWRLIQAREIAWRQNPISRRAGRSIAALAYDWGKKDDSPYATGAWKDATLGDIANMGRNHWLRMNGLGEKYIDVIEWIIDEAAEGRCPMEPGGSMPAYDAYVPKAERATDGQ